jgi:hypothetical protein
MKKLLLTKKQLHIGLFLLAVILLAGCGVSSGLMNQYSVNGANSNVVLQKDNFKVLGTVSGEASDSYLFFIGGKTKNLIAIAKKNMIEKAGLVGTSKAIINITLEEHNKFAFVYIKKTITVHGTVIEFTL